MSTIVKCTIPLEDGEDNFVFGAVRYHEETKDYTIELHSTDYGMFEPWPDHYSAFHEAVTEAEELVWSYLNEARL